jgi:peptidoglycan-N-acetylglucosamine deacetylase
MGNLRARSLCIFAVAASTAGALVQVAPARAEDCRGNPNALGTSRVLVLEPGELARVGVMQYPDSLPLADKEVVLTFDDGPLPPYTNEILDILAAQCVKATYFLVGEMARSFPAAVRRIYEAGHTIGTHSEDHPLRFDRISVEKVRWEIDQGIADVSAALGDPRELAPFFRIPGLGRTDAVEHELAARSLVVFSSDTVADDWHRHIKPSDITARAMSRLEKRGKGILLLHDIHKITVAALPELLKELKQKGFHIVHVVPGERPGRIETVGEPAPLTTGSIAPWADDRTVPNWPKVIAVHSADRIALPAPDAMSFATDYRPWRRVVLADGAAGAGILSVASADTHWPDRSDDAPPATEAELPAPSMQDIGLPLHGLQVVGETLAPKPSLGETSNATPDTATPY